MLTHNLLQERLLGNSIAIGAFRLDKSCPQVDLVKAVFTESAHWADSV